MLPWFDKLPQALGIAKAWDPSSPWLCGLLDDLFLPLVVPRLFPKVCGIT